MAKPYKARNKRIIMRQSNGRFRKTTGADFGIGGICSKCNHFLLHHYDGDERDRPLDPGKWVYRCFTCQPLTAVELTLQAEIKASKAKSGLDSMIIEAAENKQLEDIALRARSSEEMGCTCDACMNIISQLDG